MTLTQFITAYLAPALAIAGMIYGIYWMTQQDAEDWDENSYS